MTKTFFSDTENYNILNYLKIDYNGTEPFFKILT